MIPAAASRCALCNEVAELCLSHLVPAFVGRYLKETSATGYLRNGVNPNRRQQDTNKEPLLCNQCEGTFSTFENEFSRKAFPIIQGDDFKELNYDSWLLKFLVSVNWRLLVTNHEEVANDSPQFKGIIQNTLGNWRLFLLGKRNQPGGVHHMFVISGVPVKITGDVHQKTLHYLLRGIDGAAIVLGRSIGVYTKLLRTMFYSPLVPESPSGWKNTRIHAGPGRIVSPQTVAMPGLGDYIQERIKAMHSTPLSEVQRQKIADAMLKNPERAIASESFKVHQATRRLLGEKAEVYPENTFPSIEPR
jgi:hypothetical protein